MLFTTTHIKMTSRERKIILISSLVIYKGFHWLNTLQRVFLEKSWGFLLCCSWEDSFPSFAGHLKM